MTLGVPVKLQAITSKDFRRRALRQRRDNVSIFGNLGMSSAPSYVLHVSSGRET